ncbi:hypothetical protein NE237_025502 [Protea cynaroides]|uniref:Uncharacterized protein n=1 Tax=Protea cynaroides TaxID=273540 RepID=A0A9Q0H4C2_9MAGN|nr:hypothetical protein NE237_025502 [Protea cynaroides]
MENFDTEDNDSAHELNEMRENESGFYRRSISDGDAGERIAIELDSIDSSRVLCEKELERDLRVSIQNQADEEIMELRHSRSNVHGDSPDGKRKSRLQLNVVKKLHRRLQILEEDTETMKKELFAGVDDNNELLNEISQKLYDVQQHLRNQRTGEMSENGELLSATDQGRTKRVGLLQVLYQEPNPALVTRVHKADMFTLEDSTGDIKKCLNQ